MCAQGVAIHKSSNPAENMGKQLRTSENSREQLKTAENNRKHLTTSDIILRTTKNPSQLVRLV